VSDPTRNLGPVSVRLPEFSCMLFCLTAEPMHGKSL